MELEGVLRQSASAFREMVADVSDENAKYKSKPECWSILEIVEHVGVVDQLFSRSIAKTQPLAERIDNPDREQLIKNRVSSRATPISAPAISHPQGRFSNLADALSSFEQVRAGVLRILVEREEHLRYLPIVHPAFGAISGYESLLLIAAHTQRHMDQIREIKELLEKPAATHQA